MASGLRIEVEQGDVVAFAADALILKYAHSFHGADEAVALKLARGGLDLNRINPQPGEAVRVAGQGEVAAKQVVFVGTPRLSMLNYREVGELVRIGLATLAKEVPDCRHLALTLHGPGIGLDESQAFLSELKALYAAVAAGKAPPKLERVSFVERHLGRAQRLRELLEVAPQPGLPSAGPEDPDNAPHIFVAMPFSKETDDIFYYGIQKPIHAAGFLCERIDHASFTGDIVDRICQQIASADLVIAECTGANPNVYLEIGFAWGRERPTLLLAKSAEELRFDIRGHRAILYERILDLETALAKELAKLPKPKSRAAP